MIFFVILFAYIPVDYLTNNVPQSRNNNKTASDVRKPDTGI